MRRAALALVIAAASIGGVQPGLEKPVMIGGTEEFDACPSNAQVTGLNPKGDNFLTVRSRPSTKGRSLDRLGPGMVVWACDETGDGEWTGIVYSPPGQDISCDVGSPVARRQAYAGPCRTGWVASRFLVIIAG